MKFIQKHRKDIVTLFELRGFQPEQFLFKKARGRIHIIFIESGATFWYLRKRTTKLDENNQWTECTVYQIKSDESGILTIPDWETVKQEINCWLVKISI